MLWFVMNPNQGDACSKEYEDCTAALDTLGRLKAEVIDVAATGRYPQKVLRLLERGGYW